MNLTIGVHILHIISSDLWVQFSFASQVSDLEELISAHTHTPLLLFPPPFWVTPLSDVMIRLASRRELYFKAKEFSSHHLMPLSVIPKWPEPWRSQKRAFSQTPGEPVEREGEWDFLRWRWSLASESSRTLLAARRAPKAAHGCATTI